MIKTNWNLQLLYTSDKDPRMERDMRNMELLCKTFEKRYKGKDFAKTPQKLAAALKAYEKITKAFSEEKPWWYAAMKTTLNAADTDSQARATLYAQRMARAINRVQFFELNLAKISPTKHSAYLKSPSLKRFAYQLQLIFKAAPHNLTEPEEQLASLLEQPAYAMWEQVQEKNLNLRTIRFKGKELPLGSASNKLPELNAKDRGDLQKKINDSYKESGNLAEAELNAIYNYKKIMDQRRKYARPYSATALRHEMDEDSIDTLASLVTKHFSISKRFYRLHAKLLKTKTLAYADRSAKAGSIRKTFTFKEGSDLVRVAFKKIDPAYADMLDAFLRNGQVDAFPRTGKHAGAFCWGGGDLPTFVLLNYTKNILSVETFGHEMGHAIHTELSKQNPPHYQGHSTATAEVASTFFEQAVGEELESRLSKKERALFLHNKIQGDIATIFRQIACFNFELQLHTEIRKKGQLSKEAMADLMAKHLRSYIGPAMKITRDDGYAFVGWSHIRSFFYVYTYAYGQLISKALFETWKRDPAYATKIALFLKAGRSASPADIFRSIGIDTTKPEFFLLGLKSIEKDIKRLESYTV